MEIRIGFEVIQMKTSHSTLYFVLALGTVMAGTSSAQAFIDPVAGRWMTRDLLQYDDFIVNKLSSRHNVPTQQQDTLEFVTTQQPNAMSRNSAFTVTDRVVIYQLLLSNPNRFADWSGLDVISRSNRCVYVWYSAPPQGPAWVYVAPGTTAVGDTDAIAPCSPTSSGHVQKIIDCYDAVVIGPTNPFGNYGIYPVWVGGRRASGARYCCCISLACSTALAAIKGQGPVDPCIFSSTPPPGYPPCGGGGGAGGGGSGGGNSGGTP